MAGLLGLDDPKTQGLLSLAMGLLEAGGPQSRPVSFGQALARGGQMGMGAYQQGKDRIAAEEERKFQAQMRQMQMKQLQEQMARETEMRSVLAGAYRSPQQQALAGGGGPTLENAAKIPQMPGGFDFTGARDALLRTGNLEGAAKVYGMAPQQKSPLVTKPGDILRDPDSPTKILAQNPAEQKNENTPGIKEYLFAVQQGYKGSFTEWDAARKAAASTRVSVGGQEPKYISTLQEGFAKEDLKLYEGAKFGQKALQMLGRVEDIIKKAPPTGGPIAELEVWVRNFASEYGFPMDAMTDEANTRLTAEFSSFLADQIISGGRGITDEDVRVISRAIPSFKSGVPRAQLPAFLRQLRAIAQQRVNNWNDHYKTLPPKRKAEFPQTLGGRDISSPQGSGKALQDMSDEELLAERERLRRGSR